MKICQKYTKFARVGSKFCQIVNELWKNCPRLLRFYQSGEIWPNLVALTVKFPASEISHSLSFSLFLTLSHRLSCCPFDCFSTVQHCVKDSEKVHLPTRPKQNIYLFASAV